MDIASVLRRRLDETGFEQRDLAVSAGVTEGYISQLLSGKKTPPAPGRTDIYEKMEVFLRFPQGFLSNLAEFQLVEGLKSRLGGPPKPLFTEIRELILDRCRPKKRSQVRASFEKEPFGELERLVTQKLLDVVKGVVKKELDREGWIRELAALNGSTCEQTRVAVQEFLDTDIYHVSTESCISFLEPVIESWDIDLDNFGIEVVLNRRVTDQHVKKLEFVEAEQRRPIGEQPGLRDFLTDATLSGDATEEEIVFLKQLRFKTKSPNSLYYYRELQNLRDPLHFS